uniref:Env n=1 Tax=Python molurus endogenous retrovirus TaxID=201997 RepID=Q8AGX9_9RETR|nr:Env [Python molurus endogenous retrovirus]
MSHLPQLGRILWFPVALQLLSVALCAPNYAQHNPHQPQNLTWAVLDAHADILNSTSSMAVPGSWFPDLYFDFGVMMDTTTSPNRPGMVSHRWIKRWPLYVCPGHVRATTYRKKCGGENDYFCADWSCVSTGEITWNPPFRGDLITLRRTGENVRCEQNQFGTYVNCNPVKISFTTEGKRHTGWQSGVAWGGRVHDKTGEPGNIFTIRLTQTPIEPPVPVGPKTIPANRREPPPQPTPTPGKSSPTSIGYSFSPSRSRPGNPLWDIVTATYHMVNDTNPNLTTACWFCYDVRPPYYEAVGLVSPYNTSSNDKACRWKHGSQTLQSISGKGTCLGQVPTQYKQYCNTTHSEVDTTLFYIPPTDGWWACSTGLTACAHGHVISTKGFCILVQVMPRIYYHTEEEVYNTYSGSELIRHKREPISTLTVALLVGLGLTGAGTGIASFANQYVQYHHLRAAIDEDLERIETSISHLQKSLTSLSEVVLQNRRGLDLLFLKEGGLCVALREECCFYADHSGIVQDSMTKLREGLDKRKKEREGQQGWSQSWFNFSPWLTTLIGTIAGPLILLLLACTLGPCILSRLTKFVETKIGALENMVLERHHYQPIRSGENMEKASLRILDSDEELESTSFTFKTKTEEMLE